MSKPTPPNGYLLIEQRLKELQVRYITYAEWKVLDQYESRCGEEQGVIMIPSIPLDVLSSVQVWNPWQARWEKPKYLVNNVSAWLAVKEPK